MTRLPRAAAEITPEWLTDVLRDGGTHPAAAVSAVKVEPLAAGVGFMGEVTRLHLSFREPGPGMARTMIAKIPTQDPTVRALMADARVFEFEGRFYQALVNHPEVPAPRCWYSGVDVANDDYILLLEDLGGLRCGDQLAGCNPSDARSALVALADFQASFWENDALAELGWLPAVNVENRVVAGEQVYASSVGRYLEMFDSVLEPELRDIVARFGKNVRQLLDRCMRMPHTVAHFDFRLDNVFFGDGPASTRMIDFQAVARGGGAYDVGYFLSQSMAVEERRAHEHELLDEYHRALTARGVRDYGPEQVAADAEVGMLYGLIIPIWAVGGLDSSSERAVRLWGEVTERCQAAILDHGLARLLSDDA